MGRRMIPTDDAVGNPRRRHSIRVVQSLSLQGGVDPSRQRAGPESRLVAPGLSSCETLLPATHPTIKQVVSRKLPNITKLTVFFMIAP
jgi:hypothetical protein